MRFPLRLALALVLVLVFPALDRHAEPGTESASHARPDEFIDDPYMPAPASRLTAPPSPVVHGRHVSVQVNADGGQNLVGDAANEPSIAVDPTDADHMVIGWRQFDTIESNFRQAGYGYSTDGGATWTFPGVLEPGVFRSDPVLDFGADGTFYYNSLEEDFTCDVFRSSDGGATWDAGSYALGGDKQWMSVDRTGGPSDGHIYVAWWPYFSCCFPNMFSRSTDGAFTFDQPIEIGDGLRRGTTTVGVDGAVYVIGHLSDDSGSYAVAKSTSAADPESSLAVESIFPVDLGGSIARAIGPNPAGMLGQVWIVADPAQADHLYALASVDPPGEDPLDVHFVRSLDGGATWSAPVRVNDDAATTNTWQWFGTLAVAPNGRLDAVWNDTSGDPEGYDTVLRHAASSDGGLTWTASEILTPSWDPHLGFPQQNKIGDYYEMISHDEAVHLAYAATFNGEQDIYYLQIRLGILFADGFESGDTGAWETSTRTRSWITPPLDTKISNAAGAQPHVTGDLGPRSRR